MTNDKHVLRRPLLAAKFLGLLGLLGGLGALGAVWALGPDPTSQDQWEQLVGIVRVVFFACVFGGIIVTLLAGLGLLLLRPGVHLKARWFRIKVVVLVIALPALHLWARGLTLRWHAAVEAGQLEEAAARWNGVGGAFVVALLVLLVLAAWAWAYSSSPLKNSADS